MAKPAFEPNDEQRRTVKTMAGYGVKQADIAYAIGIEGIDEKTLRKYFRAELNAGMAVANVNIGRSLYDLGVGRAAHYENGLLVREELKPDRSVAIFLGKARLGLTETKRLEVTGPNGGPVSTIDLDLSVFTDEEYRLFMQLYEKARRRRDSEDDEGGSAPPVAPA